MLWQSGWIKHQLSRSIFNHYQLHKQICIHMCKCIHDYTVPSVIGSTPTSTRRRRNIWAAWLWWPWGGCWSLLPRSYFITNISVRLSTQTHRYKHFTHSASQSKAQAFKLTPICCFLIRLPPSASSTCSFVSLLCRVKLLLDSNRMGLLSARGNRKFIFINSTFYK